MHPVDEAVKEVPHILLVDDDPDTRLLARSIFERRGWEVDEAANGKEALLKIGGLRGHSLIVLDLGLPDMDGGEVLQMIRGNLHTAGIPVVVLTARTDRETERQVLLNGADDYIPKPLDPTIFLSRTKAALRRHGF
jgi:DNA-binding response OmpR family regulator